MIIRTFLFIFVIVCNNNYLFSNVNNIDKLPISSKELIKTVFPKVEIKDITVYKRTYKVELNNDIIFHFNRDGELKEINGLEIEPIPYKSIPKKAYITLLNEVKNPRIIYIAKKKDFFHIKTFDKFQLYDIVVKDDGELIKKEKIVEDNLYYEKRKK